MLSRHISITQSICYPMWIGNILQTVDRTPVRLNQIQEISMTLQGKPSIVFVHGLWADGSCFSKLIPNLQNEGFEVIASQHGLDSHAGDVDCVKRTLGRVSNPAILVGHSYGGSVITAAGIDPRVAALVYVA